MSALGWKQTLEITLVSPDRVKLKYFGFDQQSGTIPSTIVNQVMLVMDENVRVLKNFKEQGFTASFQLELYKYWLRIKGDRRLPARSDIIIEELTHYLSSIMLLDYNPENSLFTFRVIGTSCVKLYGELTDRNMNDFEMHKPAIDRLLWCVKNQKPYYAVKNLSNIDKDYVKTSFIVLPLSDDGEAVNKILVSHHFY